MVTRFTTTKTSIRTKQAFSFVGLPTLSTWRDTLVIVNLLLSFPLKRDIGPLASTLVTFHILVETTINMWPLQLPHPSFTMFPIFKLLNIGHKPREIHLLMKKSGLTFTT